MILFLLNMNVCEGKRVRDKLSITYASATVQQVINFPNFEL